MARRYGGTLACLLALAALVSSAPSVSADVVLGASPATLAFDGGGDGLLRGSMAERSVTFQNQGDEATTLHLTVQGDQADWLTLSEDMIELGPGERTAVPVTVQVPDSAANGEYEARVHATRQQVDDPEGEGASSSVVQELVVPVKIKVTDEQTLALEITSIQVPDTETQGPLWVQLGASNTGNVDAAPELHVRVLDNQSGEELAAFTAEAAPLAPGKGGQHLVEIATLELSTGAYRAQVEVRLPGGTLTGIASDERAFDVLAAGSLARSGEVTDARLGLDTASVGTLVPVEVTFTNTGDHPVTAKLRLTAEHDGATVALIESDPLRVDPGSSATFQEFYEPKTQGDHELTGHVTYDGQRAEVPGLSLSVTEDVGESASSGSSTSDGTTVSDGDGQTRSTPAVGLVAGVLAVGGAALVLGRWRA